MKKIIKLSLILFLLLGVIGCQSDSIREMKPYTNVEEFIGNVKSLAVEHREKYVNREWPNVVKSYSFPAVNDYTAIFLYRNKNTAQVGLRGDLNQWSNSNIPFEKISGTSLFYLKMPLEKNARIKYKLVVDGKPKLDPLNPHKKDAGFGVDSVFTMPDYSYPATNYYEDITHGKIITKQIKNNTMFGKATDKRKIQIYLPPNYDNTKQYRTIYFNDGSFYLSEGKVKNILDYMIAKQELEPVIAVFVDYLERNKEYIYKTKKNYMNFFVNELLPLIEADFAARTDPDGRVIVGASNGGVFATYLGVNHPDKFKYIFNHSGAPQYYQHQNYGKPFGARYRREDLALKVISIVGKYERDYNINTAKRFHRDLANNDSIIGEKLIFYPQGHNFVMWGDSFREGILWLLDNQDETN